MDSLLGEGLHKIQEQRSADLHQYNMFFLCFSSLSETSSHNTGQKREETINVSKQSRPGRREMKTQKKKKND